MTLVTGFFNEKLAQDQLLTLNIFNPSSNVSILDFNIWVFTPRDVTDYNNNQYSRCLSAEYSVEEEYIRDS